MSHNPNKNVSIPKGRQQTDKSLWAERAKTDDALAEGRKHAEEEADEAVLATRAKTDEARLQNRVDSDDSSEVERATPGGSRIGDQISSDERLHHERQISDEVLESERRHVDSILETERHENGAGAQQSFQAERKETDKNLSYERTQTDVEVQREKNAHVATQAALTTRDEFLAIVSHDLRNPLGCISMVAELVTSSSYYSAADDETKEHIDMIGRNAREGLRLISDLLDMECMAQGKLGLVINFYEVSDIITDSIQTFKHQASFKAIALKVGSPNAGGRVWCDRDRMAQVLSNLIGNAIKFTPSGGEITLSVLPGDVEFQISVADTGRGIPESMRKTVFERFWQIGKQDRKGLGLGLYISHMIVEAHGGRMWVESENGKGSTFTFTLPVSRP